MNARDTNVTTKISEVSSFSVEENPRSDKHTKVKFYYDPPKEILDKYKKFMLVSFPDEHSPPRIECELKYSEPDKKFFIEFELDASVKIRDRFIVTAGVDLNDPLEERQKAPIVDQGYIALTNAKPHPWIYEDASVRKGTLKQFLYKTDGSLTDPIEENKLNAGDRLITVYLPPDFNTNRVSPYHLQITLDGKQYLEVMHMNTAFDNLIAAEKIEPTVIVFISPYKGSPTPGKKGFGSVCPPGYSLEMRFKEYACNPKFADKLAALPDALQKEFPNAITTDPEHTIIWGFSMGALQAAYTALLHPEKFGNVVAQSMMAFNIPTQNSEQWMEGKNGENWRNRIVDTKDKFGEDITWTTSTAPLPLENEQHNEYLTQAVTEGFDIISQRKINPPKPLKFYFTAGIDEENYEPEKGTANLVVATDKFADCLREKGHIVVAHHHQGDQERFVLVVSPGSHTPITCMESTPDALTIMNPSTSILVQTERSELTNSTAMVSKRLDIKLEPSTHKQQADIENKKYRDEKISKDDTALQSTKEKKAAQGFPSKTKKKRVTSTDDFNITYGKCHGK